MDKLKSIHSKQKKLLSNCSAVVRTYLKLLQATIKIFSTKKYEQQQVAIQEAIIDEKGGECYFSYRGNFQDWKINFELVGSNLVHKKGVPGHTTPKNIFSKILPLSHFLRQNGWKMIFRLNRCHIAKNWSA